MNLTVTMLETLCAIADAAGRAVMVIYDSDFDSTTKHDLSPLTLADLHADQIIRAGLEAAFPSVFILSEESSSNATIESDYFFLVDPLDGTKEFIKRNGEFTVNIALIFQGRAVAGVVYAPALGTLFYAGIGLGAWKRTQLGTVPLHVAVWDAEVPLRVIGSRSHASDTLTAWLATLPYDHTFIAAGSSLKFCRVAEGLADIYPRFAPTSQWDTAAAQCILEAAGGAVVDLQGKTLHYGLSEPILNAEFVALGGGLFPDAIARVNQY